MPTVAARRPKAREPLWGGPSEDGITFSLLAKYLACKERFRLRVVEGLVEDEGFDHSMEYGSLFHAAEEAHRKGKPWDLALKKYRTRLIAKYSEQSAEIHKWASICLKQFPLYLEFWEKHEDETCRKPLVSEASFRVSYLLPSGRTVMLKGKFDAITLLPIKSQYAQVMESVLALKANKNSKSQKPKAKKASTPELGIFLQENKTKGQIDEEGILGTVAQNLQTMLYQVALRHICTPDTRELAAQEITGIHHTDGKFAHLAALVINHKVAGTLYNVIRRPLADRFAIKQREGRLDKKTGKRTGAETDAQFYERIAQNIRESFVDKSKPQSFFRWKVLLDDEDMEQFKIRMFNPILEGLCDWWEWISVDPFDPWRSRTIAELVSASHSPHYQTPWGVYNSLFGGFRGDYFDYLTANREYRLSQIDNLFPELE